MKVAGSSRQKLGYRFVLSRVQTQRPGSDRLLSALESKGGGATFLARVPCHRTRLGVFLRISSPSQCSAKPF